MTSITITLNDDEEKALNKRAKKNMMTLQEQVQDIIRRSAVNSKAGSSTSDPVDDKLISIFSRQNRKKKK